MKGKGERYKILFESSRDAIMTLEPPEWLFTSGNRAAVTMFQAKDEKDFISRGPGEYSPEKQANGKLSSEEAKRMIENAMINGSSFFEWTHKRLRGELFPATVLLTRVEVDGKEFLEATVRDITERKKAEEVLSKRTTELEKMNEVMVDREMRIMELKKRVDALEKKLDAQDTEK